MSPTKSPTNLPVPTKADTQAALDQIAANLEIEQNPPPFKVNVIAAEQANLDNIYRDAVSRYNQAAFEWIGDAQESQASGKPLPVFQPKPPVRQVMYPLQGFNPPYFQVGAADQAIKPPTVPPFTSTPNKGNPLVTGAVAQTDMTNAMLMQIIGDLDKIKKAMGIG